MQFHIIDDSPKPWWRTALEILTPLTSIAVVVLAIYGDRLKMKFAGPKLRIRLRDPVFGPSVVINGEHVAYVLLEVVNARSVPALNARTLVVKVERGASTGEFTDISVPYPLHLTWSPSERQPSMISLSGSHPADLGHLVKEKSIGFEFVAHVWPKGYMLNVGADQRARYHVRAYADNALPSPIFIVEVGWDGKWADEAAELRNHLTVRPSL